MFSLTRTRLAASLTAARNPLCLPTAFAAATPQLARFRHMLAPRKVKYIKRHKGIIPIPTGGSIKGTTLAYGDWGLRIKGNGVRLTAKQLLTAEEVIKRIIKVVKGTKVYIRVFPDIPVCIKVGTSTTLSGPCCSTRFLGQRNSYG